MRTMHKSCRLRVAGCGLRVAGCGLHVAGCELRVSGCLILDTGHLLSAALLFKAKSNRKSSSRLSVDRLLFIGSQLSIIIQPLRNPDKPEKTNYNIKRSNKRSIPANRSGRWKSTILHGFRFCPRVHPGSRSPDQRH